MKENTSNIIVEENTIMKNIFTEMIKDDNIDIVKQLKYYSDNVCKSKEELKTLTLLKIN